MVVAGRILKPMFNGSNGQEFWKEDVQSHFVFLGSTQPPPKSGLLDLDPLGREIGKPLLQNYWATKKWFYTLMGLGHTPWNCQRYFIAMWFTKKKAKINGKVCWLQPQYTKVYTLKLPGGKNLKVKSGTQTIDRFWRHLREELKGVNRKPGNQPMTRKIRSAQWTYWHKGTNLWEATGRMIQTLLEWKKKRQGSYELQVGQSTCENKVRLLLHCSFCQGNILSFHLWLSASVLPIFLGYHLTNSRMQTFLWKLFFYLKR